MIWGLPLRKRITAFVVFLGICQLTADAELIIHETFDDGNFADGTPGLWTRWEGGGRLEAIDGDLLIDNVGGFRTIAALREVDGAPIERRSEWSIRARLTPMVPTVGGGNWVGVSMTVLNHAAFTIASIEGGHALFQTGNLGVFDTWDGVVLPFIGEEFVVQLDAFDDKLTGYAWRVESPEEIMTASYDFPLVPGFPGVFTHGMTASFHEVWVSTTPIPLPDSNPLQAGDADRDLDFDQLDLVRVQIAAKYLTGQAATWGEGDWNGAPGGSPGNPPAGDGVFNQLDVVAAQQAGRYLTGRYAAVSPNGQRGDGQTSIIYHAGTGEVAVDAPAGLQLTSINIDSARSIFTGDAAQNLGGSFDNDAGNNIFKATFGSSFGSLSFGNVAEPGLAEGFVLSDLTVVGSLAGGGALGDVDLIYVPEPRTIWLLAIGLLGFMAARWCGR